MPKLEEVFGVTVKTPLSYVLRENVDTVFKSHIRSDKHIVVYGASKQGKSTLVAKHIEEKQKITVYLAPNSTRLTLYSSILRKLGAELEEETTTAQKNSATFSLGAKIKATFPFLGGAEVENKNELTSDKEKSTTTRQIALDLSSADDVGRLMREMGKEKIFILENFHYATDLIQRELAFDLRTFHDLELQFVILGVWREKNRLVQYNGDLLSRLVEVPVEPWTEADFRKVVTKGAKELNVQITPEAIEECIKHSCSSVAVFQELMKSLCQKSNVARDTLMVQKAGDTQHVREAIKELSGVYETRHTRVLETLAGSQMRKDKKTGMMSPGLAYALVRALLVEGVKASEQGFSREQIEKAMATNKEDFKRAAVTNLLKRLSALQHQVQISPPVLDYDTVTRRIMIVDSTFLFYLRNTDLNRVLETITDLHDSPD
jgi:hypothetical protein